MQEVPGSIPPLSFEKMRRASHIGNEGASDSEKKHAKSCGHIFVFRGTNKKKEARNKQNYSPWACFLKLFPHPKGEPEGEQDEGKRRNGGKQRGRGAREGQQWPSTCVFFRILCLHAVQFSLMLSLLRFWKGGCSHADGLGFESPSLLL